ncbi:glycoside hydrolase family 25 protein [Nocardioides endophyticus]|uniref:glycoside hydrolase family 25 protein n=1 Tax=Nocardioides endophyticus TaxID=1353775 RepID=UPI0031E6573C
MPTKVAPVRVVTANVQSFPEDALTAGQALDDLRSNAEIGDLVLLQEIASRYRPLVEQAFPAPMWTVYYGRPDNSTPIAFRRELFAKVEGAVTLLHPAVADRHRRRYTTQLKLRHREVGCEVHVLNLHLVAGAFNDRPLPDKADRVREWNEGIDGHRALVARLAQTGAPVVGGGDYNRQLKRCRPLGTEVAGRDVTYAVDPESIDLLWFIDGTDSGWRVRDQSTFAGRDHRNPQRNSDHGARCATVNLRATAKTPEEPTMHKAIPHKAFDRTTYGDVRPKPVDWKTRAALEAAERRLGYRLTVVQGSYNPGGVRQSGGTHDGGGVVDLLAWDWRRKVRVLRSIGFAAWYRPAISGLWGAHIHAVLIDHGKLSASAAAQVASYRAGRDGLKGNRADTFWRPSPIPVFDYPPPVEEAIPDAEPTPDKKPEVPEGPTGAAYPPKRRLDGVDTSHYQGGRVDLKAARAEGLQWWYVKATEGTTFVDPTYDRRVRQARKAGVPVGAYHFARPDRGDAADEARFFLATADIRAGDMLPMLDLESSEGLSPSELTTWTGTWVRTVTRHLAGLGLRGRPIIYTPFNLEKGFGCFCWVARYSNDFRAPVVPRPWQRAVIWQHSNGKYGPVKHVPGFGPVDVNAVHPDVPLAALRVRRAERPETPQPGPVIPPPEVESIPADPDRTDMKEVRLALVAAARSIEAAVARLPER